MNYIINILYLGVLNVIWDDFAKISVFADFESVKNQIFANSLQNEATIEDFIGKDIFFEIVHPEKLQYSYRISEAKGFGTKFKKYLKEVRLVLSEPIDCCSNPTNSNKLRGSVALVLRGDCSFLGKTILAEKAGAIAIIIMDNNINNDKIYMKMAKDETSRDAGIPAAFLLGTSGHMIRKTLDDMHEDAAIINIPLNMSAVSPHKMKQPPWIVW